jgi:signal transduction histidine kinase
MPQQLLRPIDMFQKTSERLAQNVESIMSEWAKRALAEVPAAGAVGSLALADSLPLFLEQLVKGLADNRKLESKSTRFHEAELRRISKIHGRERAGSFNYFLAEVIFEYHILREVIFETLEEREALLKGERDLIYSAIEQAVNDAAVQFTETHAEIQEKFVSTLTHDLRNPLSAAKSSAQLILRRATSPDICIRAGGGIIASLNRINSMIQDLLDGSKLRAGQTLDFEFSDCEIARILGEVVDEMALTHGNRFKLDLQGEVEGNFACEGLRRAFENLIGNAVKYSAPNSLITVSLKKVDMSAEVAVHNVGNPIAEKDMAILFQQYRRTKSAEESEKTGWGLGLTLVQGVVDAHHGSVAVESTQCNGTTFTVALPLGA